MNMTHTSLLFPAASLLPAGCLVATSLVGGNWAYVALVAMTLVVFTLDRVGWVIEATPRLGRVLPQVIGTLHFAVLACGLWAMGKGGMTPAQTIAFVFAMGLYFGQVSNACAHELIHRQNKPLRWLGAAIYISLLNGQHVSAHLLVHHVHAGTARDPNSAPLGRGFYRYALMASRAEFRAGLAAETRRLRPGRLHPYVLYLGGTVVVLGLGWWLVGAAAVVTHLILAAHAQVQLLLSDYVQHYGLRRHTLPGGKTEPMGPRHSWNAPNGYSAAMMLNAPLHSDHHSHPGRTFPELRHDPSSMPTLPYAMPVMAAIALVPRLWRHMMDHRATKWSPSDTTSEVEKSPQTKAPVTEPAHATL